MFIYFFYFFSIFFLNVLSKRWPPPWSAHLCPLLSGSFSLSLAIYIYFSVASPPGAERRRFDSMDLV